MTEFTYAGLRYEIDTNEPIKNSSQICSYENQKWNFEISHNCNVLGSLDYVVIFMLMLMSYYSLCIWRSWRLRRGGIVVALALISILALLQGHPIHERDVSVVEPIGFTQKFNFRHSVEYNSSTIISPLNITVPTTFCDGQPCHDDIPLIPDFMIFHLFRVTITAMSMYFLDIVLLIWFCRGDVKQQIRRTRILLARTQNGIVIDDSGNLL